MGYSNPHVEQCLQMFTECVFRDQKSTYLMLSSAVTQALRAWP